MAVEAVIFDWGGTLTPWHTIDFTEEATALAPAAIELPSESPSESPSVSPRESPSATEVAEPDLSPAQALHAAADRVWGRARDSHESSTLELIFSEAGLGLDHARLAAYRQFWEPHTQTDDDVPALFEWLREQGIKVGILSNTVWPRSWHEEIFARDGIDHLIDGAVYTSEIAWTKPAPQAFEAAMRAVGASDPSSCVFVGDRLFDDIYGARNAGMIAVHLPSATYPWARSGTPWASRTPSSLASAISPRSSPPGAEPTQQRWCAAASVRLFRRGAVRGHARLRASLHEPEAPATTPATPSSVPARDHGRRRCGPPTGQADATLTLRARARSASVTYTHDVVDSRGPTSLGPRESVRDPRPQADKGR